MHLRVHNSMYTFFSKKLVIDKATNWRHVCDVFDPLDIDLSQLITIF